MNNKISIPVKTTKFESEPNQLIYFNGPQSVGVGTTNGGAVDVDTFVGDLKEVVSIPTRTIRIPNHPFKTGQKITLNKKIFPSRIVDIEKGDVVLFPSSLFHATIPFNSNKKRITLAFDIIPKT